MAHPFATADGKPMQHPPVFTVDINISGRDSQLLEQSIFYTIRRRKGKNREGGE